MADLIERTCAHARNAAVLLDRLDGVEVVNEVVLNQVLVRVGDVDLTHRVESLVQSDAVCWLGATTRRGERLLRISVSNWSTTEHDIELTVDAIARARAAAVAGRPS